MNKGAVRIDQYLSKLELRLSAHQLEPETWVAILKTLVDDHTVHWLRKNAKGKTWEQVKNDLTSQYASPFLQTLLFKELMKVTREPGESVQSFSDRLLRGMDDANVSYEDQNWITNLP